MLIVFTKVATIFSMILIGWVANRRDILPDSAIPAITNLMLYITTPCMIMGSIYSKELTKGLLGVSLQMIICAVIFFIVMTLFSMYLVRALHFKPKEDWGVYIAATSCVNAGFMGLPVTASIFSQDLFYLMVMFVIVLNIYIFGAIPFLLHVGNKTKFEWTHVIKTICTNVILIGIAIGIVMLILGLKPPAPIDDLVQMLGDATVPLSMLLAGMQLGSSRIKELLVNRENIIISGICMFLIPVLTFLCFNFIPFLDSGVKAMLLFATAFPTAVAPVALAAQAGKNSRVLAEIVSLTTLISLAILPLTAAFITMYYV